MSTCNTRHSILVGCLNPCLPSKNECTCCFAPSLLDHYLENTKVALKQVSLGARMQVLFLFNFLKLVEVGEGENVDYCCRAREWLYKATSIPASKSKALDQSSELWLGGINNQRCREQIFTSITPSVGPMKQNKGLGMFSGARKGRVECICKA